MKPVQLRVPYWWSEWRISSARSKRSASWPNNQSARSCGFGRAESSCRSETSPPHAVDHSAIADLVCHQEDALQGRDLLCEPDSVPEQQLLEPLAHVLFRAGPVHLAGEVWARGLQVRLDRADREVRQHLSRVKGHQFVRG